MTLKNTNNIIKRLDCRDFKEFLQKTFETLSPCEEFVSNWHIDLIIEYLGAIYSGEVKRLIINVPPRSLKSIIVSVAWPAWLLGVDPSKKVIVASYSMPLALKHSEDCRLIMNSEWYKQQFPETVIRKGSNNKNKYITTMNGFRYATSIDATLTGEGADFLIVDDPHTPLQAESDISRNRAIRWYDQTFSSRLNNKKNGAIVVVMQRLHEEDLTGHLLKTQQFYHLSLPAINDEEVVYEFGRFYYRRKAMEPLSEVREGVEEIERAKKEMGAYAFAAQYLQKPPAFDSGIIKYEWFKRYENFPESFDTIIQSVDCAVKTNQNSDFSVITTWGIKNNNFYLLDCVRQKLEYHDLKKLVLSQFDLYSPNAVIIEDKASGQALIQELRSNTRMPVVSSVPTKEKTVRLLNVVAHFESGRVILPKNASWLADYEHELTNFPKTKHDDCVDSTTQFLNWITQQSKPKIMRLV